MGGSTVVEVDKAQIKRKTKDRLKIFKKWGQHGGGSC